MALSPELLEIIVCPKCKGPLTYLADRSRLNCESCRLSFKVEDDIPILLVEEAENY